MIITARSREILEETLYRARDAGVEMGSFGLYLPAEDRILEVIPPWELPEGTVAERSAGKLRFTEKLVEQVARFNSEDMAEITIGPYQFHGNGVKLMGYHTHPLPEHEATPSKEDANELNRRKCPLEIVASTAMSGFDAHLPFIAGYHQDFKPAGYVNRFAGIQIEDLAETAKKMGLPRDILVQLMMCEKSTRLVPSIDFQVA